MNDANKTDNINFIAVDFDQTLIDIHTGGRFKGTIAELSSHVRPMFIHLFKAAHASGIKIAIVTFSPQTRDISHVLEIHFPDFAHEIVIRGRDHTWKYEGNGMRNGKQEFMASAAEELLNKYGHAMEIAKKSTILFDDDDANIELALRDGVRAIWINPERSHLLIGDILAMPCTTLMK